jgi:ABC-type amino acid transport substrate-binding protein
VYERRLRICLDRSSVVHQRRQIRRIALLALAEVVLVSACGSCGSGSRTGAERPEGNIPRVIKVGSEIPYAPFELGKPPYQGFDVDLVNEIAKRLRTRARFVNTPFNAIFHDLDRHKFDMAAAGAVIAPVRKRKASFSHPYLAADLAVVARKGSPIRTRNDLAGKSLGAQRGSAGADYATHQTKARSVRTFVLIDDALNALAAGQLDAVIHEYPVARYAERARRDLAVVQTIATGKAYGFAFPKSSPLEARVDAALESIKHDGTYARVYRKWFEAEPPRGFAGPSP